MPRTFVQTDIAPSWNNIMVTPEINRNIQNIYISFTARGRVR
jgi:hypothetical protein